MYLTYWPTYWVLLAYAYLKQWWVNLWRWSDYSVAETYLRFSIDDVRPTGDFDEVWLEAETDGQLIFHQSIDPNIVIQIAKNHPTWIDDVTMEVRFWHDNAPHRYMVSDFDKVTWPPTECVNRQATFTPPIARVVTSGGDDITDGVLKYKGPFGDFYGREIPLKGLVQKWKMDEKTRATVTTAFGGRREVRC